MKLHRADKVTLRGYYLLRDSPRLTERQSLGFKDNEYSWPCPIRVGFRGLIATWTGEKRPPKKGEWYLSGALIAAYRAPNDLTTSFHIAQLMVIQTELTVTTEPRKVGK